MPRAAKILLAALLLAALLWALAVRRGGDSSDPGAGSPESGAVAGHCEHRRFEGDDFTACRYDARAHQFALVLDGPEGPLRSFERLESHLGAKAGRLLFAMNAGMYDEEGMPIGLYVEDGRARHAVNLRPGPGNFHMKPNGIFAVAADGGVAIVESGRWARSPRRSRWATQSGPMLVIAGALHPQIQPNGPSLYVRNGVGVDGPRSAWFAISDQPVSFGRFARFFRDSLGCRDALYLDGAVSSLWDRGSGRRDDVHALGPMLGVSRRP